jgi:PRTRC genetic system protein E
MFVELLPLLQKRDLNITVCALTGTEVRLTVTQKSKDKEEKSLKPYTLQGPASEVDAMLVEELKGHTDAMVAFHSSLEELKASAEATLKEAKAEAEKKIADAKKKGKPSTSATTQKPTPATKPEPPAAPGLFDSVTSTSDTQAAPAKAPVAVAEANEDDDTDPEDDPNGSGDESDESEDDSSDASASTQPPVAAATAVTASSHSRLFTFPSQMTEEEEVFQEAFGGSEDQFVAA